MDGTRRQFVTGAATAAVGGLAGLAGCSGILGSGGGPEGVIRDYVSAADDADAEAANSLLHPEGNAQELSQGDLALFENADLTVESLEVLEESDRRADVSVTLKMSASGMEETTTSQWEVRKHNGEWRIASQAMN